LSSGSIQCWGFGLSGQLGNGTTVSSLAPVPVQGISNATSVSAGRSHTCATLSSGGVKCWGAGQRLGDGSTISKSSPVDVSGISNVVSVSAGHEHSCATLSNGQIWCWGTGANLGNGSTSTALIPVPVTGISTGTSVVTDSGGTCAVLQDGTVRCWGFVGYSFGGTSGKYAYRTTPATVTGITTATSVSLGPFDTRCATLSDGTVKCWRGGGSNLPPYGVSFAQTTPRTILGVESATSMSSHDNDNWPRTKGHSCATTSKGTIKCWGIGDSGEIGNGATPTSTETPQEVIPPNSIRSVPENLVGKHLLVRVTVSNTLGTVSVFTRTSR
jgi:alpha-tubulin suppressor-like RCC1 family protein